MLKSNLKLSSTQGWRDGPFSESHSGVTGQCVVPVGSRDHDKKTSRLTADVQ